LLRPIYRETAAYGHFGRKGFPWEKTTRARQMASDLLRRGKPWTPSPVKEEAAPKAKRGATKAAVADAGEEPAPKSTKRVRKAMATAARVGRTATRSGKRRGARR